MGERLDFSLPEKKGSGSTAGALTVLLLMTVVALAAANLYVTSNPRKGPAPQPSGELSAAQVKQLAAKLDQRNLHQQAAEVWQDYLAGGKLTEAERATVLFQIGVSLEKAGQYGQAIEHYYRCEMTAPVDELASQINRHVKECFEQLGEFSALRYELMDRTSLDSSKATGAKVVAEIGAEKITEIDLDAQIERSIENQLAPMAPYMSPEQASEQKKRLLEQLRDPQAKQEFLQSWLAQEILYRQALDEGLRDKPQTKQMLDDVTRGVLSQQLMNEKLAARINITETDVQTYYQANKDKYVEPARAKIAHIRVAQEDQAAELLQKLADGGEFAELAKEFSLDEETRDSGGAIAEDVIEGADVAGIGAANEINESIFAAENPKLLTQAFETDEGWEIVQVLEKHPARQKGFDEVGQQVMQELLGRKRQEVQGEYMKEMMSQHNVIVHTSVFAPTPSNTSEVPTPQP
jgi:parvulin-like peptidyl-prolyl isomerase